jgi:hypothetical protein
LYSVSELNGDLIRKTSGVGEDFFGHPEQQVQITLAEKELKRALIVALCLILDIPLTVHSVGSSVKIRRSLKRKQHL